MTATKDDSIYEKATGRIATQTDVGTAQNFVRRAGGGGHYAEYLQALWSYNQELPSPYDYFFLVGQWALETGYGKTDYWRRDGNPAGIGIWKDGVPSPWQGQLSGTTSAAVHLAELIVHIPAGPNAPGDLTAWSRAYTADNIHLDKVIQLVGDTPSWPHVKKIDDLNNPVPPNNFVWAADPEYGVKIARRMNEIFPGLAPDAGLDSGGSMINIGNRKLRVALGAGHANTSGGNEYETRLNKRCTNTLLQALRSDGRFDVRCWTPEDGLGHFPGPLDEAAATVRKWAADGWVPDIIHEVHHEGTGTPSIRGGFFIYPDGTGLSGRLPSGDLDVDVKAAGHEMAKRLVAPFGGVLRGDGTMSEKHTGVGSQGYRLGFFGANADEVFRENSFRFISEAATYTNSTDKAIMDRPDYPARHAQGIIDAYEYLARSRGNWEYDGQGATGATGPAPVPDKAEPIPGYPVPQFLGDRNIPFFPASERGLILAQDTQLFRYADWDGEYLGDAKRGTILYPQWTVESEGELWIVTREGYRVPALAFQGAVLAIGGPTGPSGPTGITFPTGPATTGPSGATGPAQPPEGYTELELEMLRLINRFRRQAGLKELTVDTALSRAAQWFADDMAENKYFSYQHIDSKGRRWPARFEHFGATMRANGENIGWGYTPEEMLEGWVDSRPHRENLINKAFTKIGIGYAPGRGTTGVRKVWVTDFGG